ncbi:hypothetical protein DMENIID0001_041510 [Sergentomyia squamirostris]
MDHSALTLGKLRMVFERLRAANLKVAPKKCAYPFGRNWNTWVISFPEKASNYNDGVQMLRNQVPLKKNDPAIQYRLFPENMFAAWFKAVTDVQDEYSWKKTHRICSLHFRAGDYYPSLGGEKQRRLLPTAVPSVFHTTSVQEVEVEVEVAMTATTSQHGALLKELSDTRATTDVESVTKLGTQLTVETSSV